MDEAPPVRRETLGPVVLLVLDRPARGNVLDAELLDELARHTAELADDGSVRALVLTGAGRDFCLGGALTDFEAALAGDDDEARAYCEERTGALASVVLDLRRMPYPVVAAVNGQAAGAGFSLALACDLRIVSDRVRLHFAYGALGASTDGGMSWLLPRVVSPSRALALLLEQPIIRAPRALAEGLADEAVPAAELVGRAVAVATALGANARHSVSSAKSLVESASSATLAEHMRAEHGAFAAGLAGDDMRAALAARRRGEIATFGRAG